MTYKSPKTRGFSYHESRPPSQFSISLLQFQRKINLLWVVNQKSNSKSSFVLMVEGGGVRNLKFNSDGRTPGINKSPAPSQRIIPRMSSDNRNAEVG